MSESSFLDRASELAAEEIEFERTHRTDELISQLFGVPHDELSKLAVSDIDPKSLKQEDDKELLSLHRRLHQLYGAHFAGNRKMSADGMTREVLVNAEIFVQEEMQRRGFDHKVDDGLTMEAFELQKSDGEEYAPINPSGNRQHKEDPVTIEEVKDCFEKPIALRSPAVYAVGSVCNHGKSENDIDLLVRGPLDEATERVIQFRLGRAMPPRLSQRVQFHNDELGGPFTKYVPLYDLLLVPHKDRSVVEMRLQKQDDPLLEYPKKPGPRLAVLQYHTRGKSLHLDLRMQLADYLIGWTLAAQRAGAVPDINTLEQAKKIARTFSPEGDRYIKPFRAPAKVFATPKSRQPVSWLKVEGRVIGEGEVGATAEEEGVILAVDRPKVEWGLQKPFSHEYFLTKGGQLNGILYFRLLEARDTEEGKTPPGETFWTAWLSKELLPSVLKRRAVETKSMPPDGVSALPLSLEREVPKEFRYWEHKGEEARKIRDALVAAKIFIEDNIKLVNKEFRLTNEKRWLYSPDTSEVPTVASFVNVVAFPYTNVVNPLVDKVDGTDQSRTLCLLSPEDPAYDLQQIVETAKSYIEADWLIDVDDNQLARDELSQIGRPFKLDVDPSRLFAASFPIPSSQVNYIDRPFGEVWKKLETVKFALSWQYFKGQEVVRAGPTRQVWHLMIDEPKDGLRTWVLEKNPLAEREQIAGIHKPRKEDDLLAFDGEVKPGQKVGGDLMNPTKNTPSYVRILDKGKVDLLDVQEAFLKVRFHGEQLKGIFTLVAEEIGSDFWIFSEGVEPGRAIPKKGTIEKVYSTKDYKLADGTVLKDVQVWDPAKIKPVDDRTNERRALEPLALYKPQKVAPRSTNAFLDVGELLDRFPTDEALDAGLMVEPKYNGYRVSLQKDSEGRLLMFTEEVFDRETLMPNFLENMRRLKSEASNLPGPYVLDAEFMAVDGEGKVVPRRELATFRADKPVDDSGVRLQVFRALYLPKLGNLTSQSEEENRSLLKVWLPAKLKHIKLVPHKVVGTKDQLEKAIEWASKELGSEGAMVKIASSTYSLGGENDGWAKVKVARQIRAIVYDRHPVKGSPGVFNLYCGVGPVPKAEVDDWEETVEIKGKSYVILGRTFNAKIDADVGDVVRVAVTELLFDKKSGKKTLHWFAPVVEAKVTGEPDSVADVGRLAMSGEVEKLILKAMDQAISIMKTSGDERYVLGVVLEPEPFDGKGDAQQDTYSKEEVRQAAHRFMEDYRNVGYMHRRKINGAVKILESFVVPWESKGLVIKGVHIKPGTWLMGARILDDMYWSEIKQGEITGWSIGGSAVREPDTE